MNNIIKREYVTLTEAARYLGVSLGAVRLWVYTQRTLPSYKVGRRRMIRVDDLKTFPLRGDPYGTPVPIPRPDQMGE